MIKILFLLLLTLKVSSEEKYVRLLTEEGKRALQTEIVKLSGGIDLIGVVHVGDKLYYETLSEMFTQYDAILYELVSYDGATKGGTSSVSTLQKSLKNLLFLEFQLERIDYDKPNFIHADLTPSEFTDSMKERGESFLSMLMSLMLADKGQTKEQELKFMLSLFSSKRPILLKRTLAEQLTSMDYMFSMFVDSTIIGVRNDKALAVLKKEKAKGKKKIGIFYGAGHLYDFEEKLKKDHPRLSSTWLTAWDLN